MEDFTSPPDIISKAAKPSFSTSAFAPPPSALARSLTLGLLSFDATNNSPTRITLPLNRLDILLTSLINGISPAISLPLVLDNTTSSSSIIMNQSSPSIFGEIYISPDVKFELISSNKRGL